MLLDTLQVTPSELLLVNMSCKSNIDRAPKYKFRLQVLRRSELAKIIAIHLKDVKGTCIIKFRRAAQHKLPHNRYK
jgi:hypothetical protein